MPVATLRAIEGSSGHKDRACGCFWTGEANCHTVNTQKVRFQIRQTGDQTGAFNEDNARPSAGGVLAHYRIVWTPNCSFGNASSAGAKVSCWLKNHPSAVLTANTIDVSFWHWRNLPKWGDPGRFRVFLYFEATDKFVKSEHQRWDNIAKASHTVSIPTGNVDGADWAGRVAVGFEAVGDGSQSQDSDMTAWPDVAFHAFMDVTVTFDFTPNPVAVTPAADFSGDGPHLEIVNASGVTVSIPIFYGDTVQMTDLSTNTPTNWTWDGDVVGPAWLTSTAQNPALVYATTGPGLGDSFNVRLIATNAAGGDTATKNAYVRAYRTDDNVTCPANITVVNYTTATYPPVAILFTAVPVGVVDTATVNWGDGTTEELAFVGRFSHVYTNTWGTIPVTAFFTNTYGESCSTSTNVTILDPRPQPDFVANTTTGVIPLAVTFTPSLVTGKPWDSLAWQFGDGETSKQETPVHYYTATGVYTVTLVATNTYGSLSTSKVDYIHAILPTPSNITFEFEPECAYSPVTVQFTPYNVGSGALESQPLTWLWSFGDGETSTAVSPAHVYRTTADTTYVPTLTLNNGLPSVYTTTAGVLTVLGGNRGSWGRFMDELGWHMLITEGDIPVCDGWDQYGGYSDVFDVIVKRYQKFVRDTEFHVRSETATNVAANTWALPTSPPVVELLRVDADGIRLESLDHRQADLYDSDWETAGTEALGYIFEEGGVGQQRIKIVPTLAVPTTVECTYVTDEDLPATPSPCDCSSGDPFTNIPLPYVYWWVVRFGVMSDLFKREGEMQDVKRSGYCEEMYQVGVELVRAMQRAIG